MNSSQLPAVADLVSHRGPMLLLDEVVHLDHQRIEVRLIVRQDGLFDSAGHVPAWIGVEYMAQAMSALNGYRLRQRGQAIRLGFLAGTQAFRSNVHHFSCGEELYVSAQSELETEEGLGAFNCRIESRQGSLANVLCEAQVNAYAPDDPLRYYAAAKHALETSVESHP